MGAFLFLSPEEIIIVEHFDFETMSTNPFCLLSNGFTIGVFFSLLNWFEKAEEAQIALLFFFFLLHFGSENISQLLQISNLIRLMTI